MMIGLSELIFIILIILMMIISYLIGYRKGLNFVSNEIKKIKR